MRDRVPDGVENIHLNVLKCTRTDMCMSYAKQSYFLNRGCVVREPRWVGSWICTIINLGLLLESEYGSGVALEFQPDQNKSMKQIMGGAQDRLRTKTSTKDLVFEE